MNHILFLGDKMKIHQRILFAFQKLPQNLNIPILSNACPNSCAIIVPMEPKFNALRKIIHFKLIVSWITMSLMQFLLQYEIMMGNYSLKSKTKNWGSKYSDWDVCKTEIFFCLGKMSFIKLKTALINFICSTILAYRLYWNLLHNQRSHQLDILLDCRYDNKN